MVVYNDINLSTVNQYLVFILQALTCRHRLMEAALETTILAQVSKHRKCVLYNKLG
jgi:hypothetical protein